MCFPPYSFWPLIFPSIAYLFLASYLSTSAKESFFIGWFFGLAFFTFGLYWIFNSFLIRSGIYIYLLPICLFSFSCFLALFISFVTFLNYKFKTNLIFNIVFFSIFWTFSEILRGYLLTGFPWNLLAHTFSEYDIIIQICSIVGVYGLSFFIIYFVLSLSIFVLNFNKKKEFFLLLSTFFIFISIIFYGIDRLKNSDLITYTPNIFRIVQPNINQNDKLDFSKLEELYIYGVLQKTKEDEFKIPYQGKLMREVYNISGGFNRAYLKESMGYTYIPASTLTVKEAPFRYLIKALIIKIKRIFRRC